MKREDWQGIYGEAPESFRRQLRSTLNGLEESEMKRKHKSSLMLVAAALVVALLAGAGIAASELGVFRPLTDSAAPILPLEGAEELVGTNLGSVENDLATMTVEQAVFDGQGALVQLRIAPKDASKYVMFNAILQDARTDLFETASMPVQVANARQSQETDRGTMEIINKNGDVQLLLDGEALEVPASKEAALEQGLPIYVQDGVAYYADYEEFQVLGSKDGRELMDYWPSVQAAGESPDAEALGLENLLNTMDAESQPDGSVIVWISGFADQPMDVDALEITCRGKVSLNGEEHALDGLTLSLPKNEEERKAVIEPVGDGKGERFQILSGSISLTKVRAYLDVDYRYEQAASGEEMGITFRIYDADGNRITTGSGSCDEKDEVFHEMCEMQSFDEIPETIWLEAKVIGEDVTLGRVECRLVEQ